MKEKIEQIRQQALAAIEDAAGMDKLNDVKVAFLGKKGQLSSLLKGMKDVAPEDRPKVGQFVNEARAGIEAKMEEKRTAIQKKLREEKMKKEVIDVTLPGKKVAVGHRHPNQIALDDLERVFIGMGYEVVEGPEIEYDEYNFRKLNIPDGHPAKDEQDTFYINKDIVLRTQTSPVQARIMEQGKLPICILSPGRVFRSDEVDATHSPSFHQVEGLVVDKGIKFSDLKGTLEIFLKDLFGADTKIRFRASYFPFTEPSAEVDISFASRTHSESNDPDWLEILGCGMVHNMVLKLNGYDPNIVSGFAFGMGIERIAMLLYGIDDLRNFYENDIRFLEQF